MSVVNVPEKEQKFWTKVRTLHINISSETGFDLESVRGAFGKVFLLPSESLDDVVPDYWKDIRREDPQRWPPAATDKSEALPQKIAKIGNGIRPPRGLRTPDPKYSETARLLRVQGTVILWLVVDTNGFPRDIKIARAMGLGLDERAVEAVRQWRFEPATKDGQRVLSQINVEVNFRLY